MSPVFRRTERLRIRGVILAAGFGTRLRPLTNTIAKPLLPVGGQPLIHHTLRSLALLGCDAVVINLHHRGDDLRRELGSSFGDLPIVWSEEPQILGTWGGLLEMREALEDADLVVVINGDSLCNWPLRKLVRQHTKQEARATLLLSRFPALEQYEGGVGVDREGRIRQLRGQLAAGAGEVEQRGVFAGAQVFSPELLRDRIAEELPADTVSECYLPMLDEAGALQALVSRGPWWDLGTPARYLEGVLEWLELRPHASWMRRRARRVLSSAHVAEGAGRGSRVRIRRSMIEATAVIEDNVHLTDTLVLRGARIGAGSRLNRCIVAADQQISPGSRIEGQLVTSLQAGRDPGGRDSVIGQLVFTPIQESTRTATAGRRER